MSVAKKRRHASKKNKADWRKNCDIRDVEDFLEDQRLEERLGKFTTKPDSELFVIDTGGEADKPVEEATEKPLSAKQLKRAKLAGTPKCFEVLLPSSKVQDPNAKRNHKNPIGHRPTALSKITDTRRATKGVYVKKLEDARKNRKIAVEKRRKIKQIRQNFSNDLWDGETPEYKGIPDSLVDDFISPEAQLHNVLPIKRLRAKPPLAKTVVTRSAVEAPHPGVSYNPSYQEHQELLQQVVAHEEKQMKRERHLLRVTNGMFRKITPKEMKNQWQEEMSVGLKPDNPAEQSDNDTDDEIRSVNPPVLNKKKDHKTRRKQRERLVEKEKRKQEKINKKKISDIYTLRKIKGNIVKKEDVQAKERAERLEKRVANEATALPKLSGHKTPKREPDFVDPATLSGDLRTLNSNTNLLRERFESLQRRGALAASKLMMKKKRRVKSYFKPGHKVTDQDVDKYMEKVEKAR